MSQQSIIIIGGGVAGLMAAKELSAAGRHVRLLEATPSLGGRIRTLYDKKFNHPVEAGAEFVHGELKFTHQLLKEAGLELTISKGKMLHVDKGNWQPRFAFTEGWDELMQQMESLQEDMTIAHFLETYFGDEKHKYLRQTVQGFAEGYDLADIEKASTLALCKEWLKEDENNYRVTGGYAKLVSYLENIGKKQGCSIYTSTIVQQVNWQKDKVIITTNSGEKFIAQKLIVAVPLGILQSQKGMAGHIEFTPTVPAYLEAAKQIGFGTAIKIVLQFSQSFWQQQVSKLGFAFSEESVPAWWTQAPFDDASLTGWITGANAEAVKDYASAELLEVALKSLSNMFCIPLNSLYPLLVDAHIANWANEPFVYGAYSYSTLGSEQAKIQLTTPVEGTIFFAGEALYNGDAPGTVEAALVSGYQTAQQIICDKA